MPEHLQISAHLSSAAARVHSIPPPRIGTRFSASVSVSERLPGQLIASARAPPMRYSARDSSTPAHPMSRVLRQRRTAFPIPSSLHFLVMFHLQCIR